jgi:hypothetical protein
MSFNFLMLKNKYLAKANLGVLGGEKTILKTKTSKVILEPSFF